MNPSEVLDERLTETVTLKMIPVASIHGLSPVTVDSLTFKTFYDPFSLNILAQLSAYVMSDQLQETMKEVYFDMPDGWWQMFKQQYFPEWAVLLWPVKIIREYRRVTFERHAVYPQLSLISPGDVKDRVGKIYIHETMEAETIGREKI